MVDVVVATDEGASELTGVTLSLSYPPERLTLPAATALLHQRVQLVTPDEGHDDLLVANGTTPGVLRLVYVRQPLASAAAIESGPLLRVTFHRGGGDGAAIDDLRCEVVDASDRMARPRTNVTCRVQIPRP